MPTVISSPSPAAASNLQPSSEHRRHQQRLRPQYDHRRHHVGQRRSPASGLANAFSGEPVIGADGTYVSFSSYADNLTSGAVNGHDNVYETNLSTMHTILISTAAGTEVASNGTSYDPSISGRGIVCYLQEHRHQPGEHNPDRQFRRIQRLHRQRRGQHHDPPERR